MNTSSLEKLVCEVRLFLEPLWTQAHESWADSPTPYPPSKQMCRYSCIFLKEVLAEASFGVFEIKLGRPITRELDGTHEGRFGYRSADGRWHDHAWLTQKDLLIDITADQFGGPAVTVATHPSSEYHPNMSETEASENILKLQNRVNVWLQAWRTRTALTLQS